MLALISVTSASASSKPDTLRSASCVPPITMQRRFSSPIRNTGKPFIRYPALCGDCCAETRQQIGWRDRGIDRDVEAEEFARVLPRPCERSRGQQRRDFGAE